MSCAASATPEELQIAPGRRHGKRWTVTHLR
jgi:hypothetical protein